MCKVESSGKSAPFEPDPRLNGHHPQRSLAASLTSREYARVAHETTKRIGRDTSRTKAEYLAELRATARELYPEKGL